MMEDYPKEIILRDGSGVTLRPLREGDEKHLFEMFNRLPKDDRWFIDRNVQDFGLIENWVRNLDLDRVFSIVAVLEGKIIANAILMRKYYGAKSHIGEIVISVDPVFRERHLGTWMLLDLINLGISVGLEMVEMRLVEGRDATIARAVKKLEFVEEAVLRDYVKDRNGIPQDMSIMVKRFHRVWDYMEGLVSSGEHGSDNTSAR